MDSVDVVGRWAARVILLDAADRVLLIQILDAGLPDQPYWLTPGGGRKADEDLTACAVRELYEETGLRFDPAGLSGPVRHEVVDFPFEGVRYRQEQEYFVARVPGWEPAPVRLTAIERRSWRGYRWWSVAELEATAELYYPRDLPALLGSLSSAGDPRRTSPGGA